MKKAYLLSYLFVCIGFLNKIDVNAQIVVWGDSTNLSSLEMNECGAPDTFRMHVRVVTGSLTGPVTFNDTLPTNFSFISPVSSGAITSSGGQGTNIVSLTLDAATLNAAGPSGTSVYYLVRTRCGANGLSAAPHGMLLEDAGSFSSAKLGQDFVSAITAPTIILEARNVVNEPNAMIGGTYTRNWRIRNTGVNSVLDTTIFRIVYQDGTIPGSVSIDGVVTAPTSTNGDTSWFQIIKALRNQSVFSGDTIFVSESYTVDACPPATGNSDVSAYWGCMTSPICDIGNLTAATQVPLTVPSIRLVLGSYQRPDCGDNYDTITSYIINDGPGDATQIEMEINQGWNGNTTSNTGHAGSIGWWDTSKVFIKYGAGGTYQKVTAEVLFERSQTFWTAGDKPVRIRLTADTLSSGDTLYVELHNFRGCVDASLCNSQQWHQMFANVQYQNNCGSANYQIPDWVNLNLEDRRINFIGSLTGDGSDMDPGDTISLNLSIASGANDFIINDPSGYFAIEVAFPAGMLWDGDTNDLRYNGARVPDSIYYNTTTRVLQSFWFNNGSTPQVSRSGGSVIQPKFYLDCSIPGSGGAGFFVMNAWDVENANCSCSEPYFCGLQYGVNNHCPLPCPRGGVVPFSGTFERINLGLPDNDQDGQPDGSGSLNLSLIELDKVMRGDTFKTSTSAYISVGSQSPAAFTHGYAEITIPTFGTLISMLRVEGRVKDFSTGITHTITGITFSEANTGGGERVYTIDYSPSTASGYPGGYTFDDNDSMWFDAFYVMDLTPGVDNGTTATLRYYVSPYANPTDDTAKYRCDYYSPNFNVVRVFVGSAPNMPSSVTGCNQITGYYRSLVSVGQCCSNYSSSSHFAYEYRNYSTLDSMVINLPPGFTLDSAYAQFSHTEEVGSGYTQYAYSLVPIRVDGSTVVYDLQSLYTTNGGTIVPSKGGEDVRIYVSMSPSCGTNPGTVDGGSYTWYRTHTPNWSWLGATSSPQQDDFTYLGPNVSVANFGANTAIGISEVVSWDVSLQNASTSDDAPNTWLGFNSPNSNITVDSVRDLTTNLLLTNSGGIFQVGDLPMNGVIKNYRLYASYSACTDDSLVVYTSWNCSPPGYPTDFASRPCEGDSVKVYIQSLNPVIQTTKVSEPSFPVDLCDTLQWEILVSSRQQAAAYDVTLDVVIPGGGAGATVVPTYGYKYPATAGTYSDITPVDMGGGIYRFYLSDSIPGLANGLRPIGEAPNNDVQVLVRILTDCNFPSGTNIRFVANGKKACGDTITPDAEFSPVTINGAPTPKVHQPAINISPDTITGCSNTATVELKFRNYELSATSGGDKVRVVLATGTEYVPTTTFSRNAFSVTEPTIDTIAGLQRLTWEPGTAIPSLDSAVWTITLQPTTVNGCPGTVDLTAQTLTEFTAVCATVSGGFCTANILNGEEDGSVTLIRPDLSWSSFTGVYLEDSADHTYSLRGELVNSATGANVPTSTAINIQYYRDDNGNNLHDAGDVLLGSKTFNYGWAPGESKSLWASVVNPMTPDNSKGIYAVVDTSGKFCLCSQPTVSPMIVGLPVNITTFEATLVGEDAHLHWITASEEKNDKFEIMRKLEGEDAFTKVGEVKGAGTSNELRIYNYLDNLTGQSGNVLYKLRQVDYDGQATYSEVRVVSLSALGQKVRIYPNPTKDKVRIEIPGLSSNFQYRLVDALGKVVVSSTAASGEEIDFSQVAEGTYFIQVYHNGTLLNNTSLVIE